MSVSLTEVIKDLPDVTVVDIGSAFLAGDLKTDYQALIDLDKVRVVGFDPNPKGAAEFEKKHNGKHKIHPFFIGDGSTGTFHENNNWPTSSLYPTNHDLVDKYHNLGKELMVTQKTSEVETKRLDDLQSLSGLEDVDAIYIDIQGAELQTLQNATEVLSNVVLVHTEVEFVELYIGQPLFADVDIFLRDSGFMFHTFPYMDKRCLKPIILNKNPGLGLHQYLWADAVYVRDILKLDALSDHKLLKLALIVNDVYGSFDLCHYILEVLDLRNNTSLKNEFLEALMAK